MAIPVPKQTAVVGSVLRFIAKRDEKFLTERQDYIDQYNARFCFIFNIPLYLSSRSDQSPFTNGKYVEQNFNFNFYWLLFSQQIFVKDG